MLNAPHHHRTRRFVVLAVPLAVVTLGLSTFGVTARADDGDDDVATLGTDATDSTDPSSSDAATGPASTDPEQAMLDYAQCMRDHGIDMPDPQFSADGTGGRLTIQHEPTGSDVPGPQPGDAVFDEAESACRPLMEAALSDVTVDPERQAEMREQMLDYAECMREHGVDVPDPVFSDNGMVTMQVGGPGVEPLDDATFTAANAACSDGTIGMAVGGPPASEG